MVRIGRPRVPIRILLTDAEFVTFLAGFRRQNRCRKENRCLKYLGSSESSFACLSNREHSTIGPIFIPIIKMALPFYAVDTVNLIAGALQRRQQRFVEAWAELHQEELLEDWGRLQSGYPPLPIDPLR